MVRRAYLWLQRTESTDAKLKWNEPMDTKRNKHHVKQERRIARKFSKSCKQAYLLASL